MKKRSKFRTIMCLLLAVLLVIPVTALDIFTGTEEELELQKIPNELNNVLESVFFSLGKTENQFEELNISQYFLDSEENTSYQYLAKRAEYYMSFRPKIFDPVVDLKQKIELVHCESVIGGYTLELIHTAEFSYAHEETNSLSAMRYSVDVAVTENGYTLLSVTPLDDKLYEQYVETPQEVDTAIARNNITAFQRAVAGSAEVEVSTCENELTSNSNIQPMGTTQGNYTYINRTNAINYSYTYLEQTNYNRLFGFLSADCMNFVSQCLWAGLGGSDSPTAVANGTRPMDKSGSYLWYRTSSGNSASWQGTISFLNYIDNMNAANVSGTESGLLATRFDIASGATLSSVPSTVRVGSVAIGPMPAAEHAVLIVKSTGAARSQNYYNAHNPTRQEYTLDWEWGTQAITVVSVGSYINRTTCSHTYSSATVGSDAICNSCGYNRITVEASWLKPVAAGTTQTLTANFVQPVQWAKYKVYTVNTNGTRGTLLYTSPTQSDVQSISGTYSFTSAGLYEVEFEVVDCSVSGTTITGSMRVRVK